MLDSETNFMPLMWFTGM